MQKQQFYLSFAYLYYEQILWATVGAAHVLATTTLLTSRGSPWSEDENSCSSTSDRHPLAAVGCGEDCPGTKQDWPVPQRVHRAPGELPYRLR